MSKDELTIEDFKEWVKDPRGEPYWEAVKGLLADRAMDVAAMVTKGDLHQAGMSQGAVESLKHVLAMPDEIIEEKKGDGDEPPS